MSEIAGHILTPQGWRNGILHTDGERIATIEDSRATPDRIIVPGFIDLHCHGGGGADVMEAGEAVRVVARTHGRAGTTAFLATTMTDSQMAIEAALKAAGEAELAPGPGEAAVLGVHLEGPFISRTRLGAQPDFVKEADVALMERFLALARIRVVTCAPEADPDGALTAFLRARGIRVQIGHSSCDYETASRCLADGRHGVTHMFNAMSPLHHRAPGVAGAALAHAEHAELIPDLLHVHPGAIRVALRAIPGLYAVTDATAASGMADGTYRLGTQTVRKCGNGVRLGDGTLAGSSLTMLQAFRNLVSLGLSLEEASRRTSTIPADYLGLHDRGRLKPGAIADLIVLDSDLAVHSVFIRGREITEAAT